MIQTRYRIDLRVSQILTPPISPHSSNWCRQDSRCVDSNFVIDFSVSHESQTNSLVFLSRDNYFNHAALSNSRASNAWTPLLLFPICFFSWRNTHLLRKFQTISLGYSFHLRSISLSTSSSSGDHFQVHWEILIFSRIGLDKAACWMSSYPRLIECSGINRWFCLNCCHWRFSAQRRLDHKLSGHQCWPSCWIDTFAHFFRIRLTEQIFTNVLRKSWFVHESLFCCSFPVRPKNCFSKPDSTQIIA
jgi:hypothetical protein